MTKKKSEVETPAVDVSDEQDVNEKAPQEEPAPKVLRDVMTGLAGVATELKEERLASAKVEEKPTPASFLYPPPSLALASETENEKIARICHEVNRAYCAAIGDFSQAPWDQAPSWQRHSALLGVEFAKANPHAGPDASHKSWMRQKLLEGWKQGLVKDPKKKEHPCMVAFEDLPKEQQAKDYLFTAIVKALA